MVRILAEVICTTLRPEFRATTYLFLHLHTAIQQKYMVLFHLIFLLRTTNRPKIRVLNDFFLLCVHDHSTEIYGPLSLTLFCARPFDQDLESKLIYIFYLYTTIRQKYMFLFHLFFLFCSTIRPKISSLTDLHLLFAHDHSTRIYGPLSCNLSFVHNHLTKN